MPGVWQAFQECGVAAVVITLLVALGLVATLVASVLLLTTESRNLGIAAAVLTMMIGVGAVTVGYLGNASGRSTTDVAVSELPDTSAEEDASRERIRLEGYGEARQCTRLGLGGGALPLTAGTVLLIVGAIARRKSQPDPV